ncbi:MAG: hypothetical protein P4L53_14390 [Candidatus Obscuribacterales bacterium]|nr:hypothetical protein [Candidatus Obscuribacterales bacterium]
MTKKTRKPLQFAKPNHIAEAALVGLSAYHLDRLIELDAARSQEVRENQVVYPSREVVVDLSTPEIVKLGFIGRGADVEDAKEFFHRHRRGRNRRNKGNQKNRGGQNNDNRGGSNDKDAGGVSTNKPKGKGKSKGGNSGGGKRLPDPLVAHNIFSTILGAHLKPVDGTGNVKIIEWNAEFLNADKVAYFKELYTNVATFADFIAVEEATHDGLRAWAAATGYVALCSEENSRGQAVGALINPKRLKIRKTAVYNSLKVMGINDLRPGFHIFLTDVVTGLNFAPIVLHLKSMRGGEVTSGKVRQLQCEKLIEAIGVGKFGGKPALGNMKVFPFFRNTVLGRDVSDHAIVYWELQTANLTKEEVALANEDELDIPMGDMNSKLDTATDVTGTLEAANYLLVNKKSKIGTQSMGPSRLDGAFRNQPNDTAVGGGNGGDPHGPFSDDPSESGVEIDVN